MSVHRFRPQLPPKVGYCEILREGTRLYRRLSDDRLFNADMTPVIPYTQEENRERAYETLPIIEYNERLLTVDEAAKLFWQYFPDAERQNVTTELATKISDAKAQIRELYPDVEPEVTEP